MPAVVEKGQIITLTQDQKNKIGQIKGIRERFKLHLDSPNRSPFSNLDSTILQKLLAKGIYSIRQDLIKSGLTAEETEALTGLKSQPMEVQKRNIVESEKSGVLFDANTANKALLNDIKKLRES